MKKLCMLMLVFIISSVILPYQSDIPAAHAQSATVRNYVAYENDFESGQTFSNHEIVSDSDASRGKVAYFSNTSSKNRDFSMPNNNKIRVYLDVKLSSQSTFGVIIRGTDADGAARTSNYLIQITNGLIAGTETTIASGEWHNISIELDYVAKKYSCTVCDSAGMEVADLAGQKFDFKKIVPGNQTAVRLSEKGDIYLDNIRLEEDIIWPQLDKITGSDGSAEIGYDEKTVVLKMTQPMAAVSKEHITVKSSVDGSIFPVSSVTVEGNDITIALDRKLQSSATYTLALSGDAAMSYKSLPIEDDVTASFTTTEREFDVGDASFSSDGSTATLTLANNMSSEQTAVVVISSYDNDGRLYGLDFSQVTIAAGDDETIPALDVAVPDGGHVRLFAVKNFDIPSVIGNKIYIYCP